MKGVNTVMNKVNQQMDVKNINNMIREFSKNSEKFGLQQEMVRYYFLIFQMQDAMDMAFDSPEADAEADDVYNQVLAEQGLAVASMDGGAVGTGVVAGPEAASA